ncbi:hypothetical protein E3C22_14290 [Jiella endophytica]|uniref:UDP-N-acetylglucosamine kinase n=1 Tax=Jiella endophytica TaxID=2558362 RepID=A0A4Y8RGQ6_9HYPH|nr:AAA family ATPase [Jiella endophytica]TFF21838.1 hypothetical protein E3C22_14290 [Jiella endophytica]
MRPTLVLLAGPNGAGKSTLYETRVAPSFAGPFINADLIQRDELEDPSMQAAYKAAEIAADRRDEKLKKRGSFATETVFSHPSKLELIRRARDCDFLVVLMHVGIAGADLSVERVKGRTEEGGHDVPEAKIRARYDRGGPLIREAVLLADRGMVFDNSALNAPPRRLLVFRRGHLAQADATLPDWVLAIYDKDLRY